MSVDRVIPRAWLPTTTTGKVHRIIVHWTAGTYTPNVIDRAHYHYLINGLGHAVRGPRAPGLYLPHTRNLNTGSVGLSICAMGGAQQGKTHGAWPLTGLQWERAAQAAAEIVHRYGLAVTERTVLFHSEVERVYGKTQRGKWDVDCLPFDVTKSPTEIHAEFRRKVTWYLERV